MSKTGFSRCFRGLNIFPYKRKSFIMNVYKPLRAVIFSYDTLRLIALAATAELFPVPETLTRGGFFPYLVYLSSNALFPMISFFLFLKAAEYRNYLPLYMAGKTIAVVLFYVWTFFSLPYATGFTGENVFQGVVLLGLAFFVSLGDTLSLLGTWLLNRKLTRIENPEPEANGGL